MNIRYFKRWFNRVRFLFFNYSVWNGEGTHGQLFFALTAKGAKVKGERLAIKKLKSPPDSRFHDSWRNAYVMSGLYAWPDSGFGLTD